MPSRRTRWTFRCLAAAVLAVAFAQTPGAQQDRPRTAPPADASYTALVSTYCVSCHNTKVKAGSLDLATINAGELSGHPEEWEKVVRKLRARQMPPVGSRRPDEAGYTSALASLEASLDRLAVTSPNPGRTETF